MNYPEDFINKIICGNCHDLITYIPDKSVDIVFTDPPYNKKKDYGVYKDNLPNDIYIGNMANIIFHSIRVARRGVLFYVGGTLTKLFYDLLPNSHLIVVHKRAVGVMAGNYFLQYHVLFSTAKPQRKTKDLWDDIRLPGEGYFFREKRYKTPGLTSLALTKKVIETFSSDGDVILDPYMGVGTTAEACVLSGRQFIGMELSQEYCDIAMNRISNIGV